MSRGIRQGCPLSALLFILVVEVLALNIRNNKKITGIKLPKGYEAKISQFADDTTLFIGNEASIVEALKTVDCFSHVAGPVLNRDKTEGLWLSKRPQKVKVDIKWTNKSVKALGVYFGVNKKMCEN